MKKINNNYYVKSEEIMRMEQMIAELKRLEDTDPELKKSLKDINPMPKLEAVCKEINKIDSKLQSNNLNEHDLKRLIDKNRSATIYGDVASVKLLEEKIRSELQELDKEYKEIMNHPIGTINESDFDEVIKKRASVKFKFDTLGKKIRQIGITTMSDEEKEENQDK